MGRNVGMMSTLLMVLAGAAFLPAFLEAGDSIDYSLVQYGPQLQTVFDQLPVLIVAGSLAVLGIVIVSEV